MCTRLHTQIHTNIWQSYVCQVEEKHFCQYFWSFAPCQKKARRTGIPCAACSADPLKDAAYRDLHQQIADKANFFDALA